MKPEFMRLRRALASTLAALLMAVGIVVLSPALSASAHHNTISVKASCDNGEWKITWKITNSEHNKSETITSSSDESIIANGTVIDDGDTYVKTETVSGPVKKTLSISAKWDNGVKSHDSRTIKEKDFKGTCEVPDNPSISISGSTCSTPGENDGTVKFNLTGATQNYTVQLLEGNTVKATVHSNGGAGTFTDVAPGTYKVKASSGNISATSKTVKVELCATPAPEVALVVEPCVAGGSPGAVSADFSKLTVGSKYSIKLHSNAGAVLETLPLTAAATTHSMSFPGHGPGEYYVTISDDAGTLLTTSANATVLDCPPELAVTVQLEPCVPLQTDNDREIAVTVDGMAATTVYTVQLVTADAAATEIASVTTPGGSATSFSHTFTGVPTGDYKVLVIDGPDTIESATVTATKCGLVTLAPPSITLAAPVCEDATSPEVLTARMIDLDPTKTYYVRIVDDSGTTVQGGDDQEVTGSATATVTFPAVPLPGTYSAQLLIDPGKQLAATSGGSTDLTVCLPTLAMTGPGVLVPLGSVAALLLTLGGAVVTGRLRRRMAL